MHNSAHCTHPTCHSLVPPDCHINNYCIEADTLTLQTHAKACIGMPIIQQAMHCSCGSPSAPSSPQRASQAMPIRYKASLAVLLCVPKCVELNLCNPPSANCDQHIHSSTQAQGAEVRNIKPLSISHQASLSMPTHQARLAVLLWLPQGA